MDLNLYLGFPRSATRLRSFDLGSDLVLGSSFLPDEFSDSSAVPQPGNIPTYSPTVRPDLYSLSNIVADLDSERVMSGNFDRTARLLPQFGVPSVDAELGEEIIVSGEGASNARYSPSYVPLRTIPEEDDDIAFAPYPPILLRSEDIFQREEGHSLHPDVLEPEVRFRRLIELQSQPQGQRPSQFLHSYDDLRDNYEESAEHSGKNKSGEKGVDSEVSEEKKNSRGVDFECNICLDLAEEPVVTSCGHLFCWPCLYQWLNLHCSHRECPVCKGEVIESTITPVYGRGNAEIKPQKGRREEETGLKIPPRPRGRRVESWRQRIRRPVSRRLSMGISSAWRRVLGEDIPLGEVEATLQETINNAHRRVATRLRARRTARVEVSSEPESLGMIHPLAMRNSSQENGSSLALGPSTLSSFGLTRTSINVSRILESLNVEGHSGASASSGNLQIQQSTDQASASSTMALIQDQNSAGSSRPLRNRGMSSGSSLDVDECPQQGRKRRRTS